MNVYIALLRGINVSGVNKILMVDLKELFIGLKFSDPISYIQSGNVVFRSTEANISKIENKISSAIHENYSYNIEVLVLSRKSFIEIFKINPFIKNESLDQKKIYTMFLGKKPDIELFNLVKNDDNYPEEMILKGKTIYMYYVNGCGRSKVTTSFIEKKLNVKATARNWNTVRNLDRLLREY
jgi:uncharacterized protein (DUF1697 family)